MIPTYLWSVVVSQGLSEPQNLAIEKVSGFRV